ncbi:hypothetical protein DACRYDRAFT_21738 [Dacryopinax primogenitus]|uniref:Uncharacterized protein n=1 Tax=Dacryopinax primogenitus (strain DJM 731) TaxID=1858805 RepID=M5G3H8_DACPD|nr:uncharacterized protein DACRYDRAFT_21738 [Dacryopinax primogenitus]EJU02775.1 hypothetical protein DACRYDRAFT_21738 [Dacryopinax primogenitus]
MRSLLSDAFLLPRGTARSPPSKDPSTVQLTHAPSTATVAVTAGAVIPVPAPEPDARAETTLLGLATRGGSLSAAALGPISGSAGWRYSLTAFAFARRRLEGTDSGAQMPNSK